MSLPRIIALLMLLGSSAMAESPEITPRERKDLLQDWKSVRFGSHAEMNDSAVRGPTILLQRLDSKQVVLSVIPQGLAAQREMPIAVALVSKAHADQLIGQALDFYAIVRQETPLAKSLRDSVVLFVDIVTELYPGSQRHRYLYFAEFDDGAKTMGQFTQFTDDASKRPKD